MTLFEATLESLTIGAGMVWRLVGMDEAKRPESSSLWRMAEDIARSEFSPWVRVLEKTDDLTPHQKKQLTSWCRKFLEDHPGVEHLETELGKLIAKHGT